MMQDVFNLLPNLSVDELLTSFAVKSNDMMLAVYLASMIRRWADDCSQTVGNAALQGVADELACNRHVLCSVLALHNLIDNQEQRVWQEKFGQKRPETKNGKVGSCNVHYSGKVNLQAMSCAFQKYGCVHISIRHGMHRLPCVADKGCKVVRQAGS